MEIAIITWVDTFGCPPGWDFLDEVESGYTTIQSIGWIEHETEDYIFLAPHKSRPASTTGRTQVAGHMTIPRRSILKKETLTSSSYLYQGPA